MVETDKGMAFIPNDITVAKREQIKFTVTNAGELDHEIVIATEQEDIVHAEVMKKDPHMAHNNPNMLRLAPGKRTRSSGISRGPVSSTCPTLSPDTKKPA